MNREKLRVKMDTYLISLRRHTYFLSRMVMPNLSIFFAWCFLRVLLLFPGWDQQLLNNLEWGLLSFLFPIMIAYTGGRQIEASRGGIVGAIAVLGVINASAMPAIFGALLMGPIGGYCIRQFDRSFLLKIKSGYEMLAKNFSAGVIGGLLFCGGYFFVGPALNFLGEASDVFLSRIIQLGYLPLLHLFVEPLKLLFFNNIINHGVFTPLGLEHMGRSGTSILFLIEANPGPGMGILLALIYAGTREVRGNAGAAFFVHSIGGIHESYFPFLFVNPALLLALIAGGASGTFVFQLFQVGLNGPASPGSLLAIITSTPYSMYGKLFLGILISIAVSFTLGIVILKASWRQDKKKGEVPILNNVKTIVFACDAGMGSSAMGASMLKKELEKAHLRIPVSYESVHGIKESPDTLIVTQQKLYEFLIKQLPNAQIYIIDNLLDKKEYEKLLSCLLKQPRIIEKSNSESEIVEKQNKMTPIQKVVFLYEGNQRGAQTMAVVILKSVAHEAKLFFPIEKEPIETARLSKDTLYIVADDFPKIHRLSGVPHLVIDNLVVADNYHKLFAKGGRYVFK